MSWRECAAGPLNLWNFHCAFTFTTCHIYYLCPQPKGCQKEGANQPIDGLTRRIFPWCLSQNSPPFAIRFARHFRFLLVAKVFPLPVKYFIAVAHIFARISQISIQFWNYFIIKTVTGWTWTGWTSASLLKSVNWINAKNYAAPVGRFIILGTL